MRKRTLPILHRQFHVLEALIIGRAGRLVAGVRVLREVGVREGLLRSDTLLGVQLQHLLQQIYRCKKAKARQFNICVAAGVVLILLLTYKVRILQLCYREVTNLQESLNMYSKIQHEYLRNFEIDTQTPERILRGFKHLYIFDT